MTPRKNIFPERMAPAALFTALSGPVYSAQAYMGVPVFMWLGLIFLLLALFAWLRFLRGRGKPIHPSLKKKDSLEDLKSKPSPDKDDSGLHDLNLIVGVNPRIADLLKEAQIMSLSDLAQADKKKLKKIIENAELSDYADPSSWPKQAQLATSGKWEELKTLQDEMRTQNKA